MLIQLMFVLSTIALAGCDSELCSVPSATDKTSIKIVTPAEVAAMTGTQRKPLIVDANPREVFDEGHVPGARWMATGNVRDVLPALPADRGTLVVFYCYSEACGASHAAAKQAIDAGWTNVARMSAGISGWKAAGLPVER